MGMAHSWGRLVAEEVHKFYMNVEEYLMQEYEDEWVDMAEMHNGELLMVEMHLHALQRLAEHRLWNKEEAHISLHEYFRQTSYEVFAEDFWHSRDPMLSQRAQRVVRNNDNGLPLYRPVRVAYRLLENYGDAWVDMPDEVFKEAWDWLTLVDQDERPKMSWD